jgi:prepilin-type N-terminal cleavage/methylation domain-containing protein
MMGKLEKNKGFTLVELLIVSGLIAVVLLPISIFFTANLGNFYRESDKISSQVEAGRLMELITARVMEASKYEEKEDGSHVFTTAGGKWVFMHEESKLSYNKDEANSDTLIELSDTVTDFDITPVMRNSKAVGVRIRLEVTHKRGKNVLNNTVYFRNQQE